RARVFVARRLQPSVAAFVIALVVSGCTVGPDYKRPPVMQPDVYRGGDETQTSTASIADEKWWDIFDDDVLQALVQTALEHNDDVRLAAARILEAQAQLGITHADQFPTVSGGVGLIGQRTSAALGFAPRNVGAIQIQGSAAWEIDFWGKFRRATEAARA